MIKGVLHTRASHKFLDNIYSKTYQYNDIEQKILKWAYEWSIIVHLGLAHNTAFGGHQCRTVQVT